MARLVGPDDRDVESALALLASDLLRRSATKDDEVTLVALASTPRFVSPVSEAAIRRALLAIAAHDGATSERGYLVPLATAVGLADTFNLSEGAEANR
jgi:hypothetical protein